MLTIEDCIALSGLSEDEIDAIAEHEHIPEMVAVEFGCYLVELPGGERRIRRIIRDDIATAVAHGDAARAAVLRLTLQEFVRRHQGAPATSA